MLVKKIRFPSTFLKSADYFWIREETSIIGRLLKKLGDLDLMVVFLPIFVADTKITFVYNFVAPLRTIE